MTRIYLLLTPRHIILMLYQYFQFQLSPPLPGYRRSISDLLNLIGMSYFHSGVQNCIVVSDPNHMCWGGRYFASAKQKELVWNIVGSLLHGSNENHQANKRLMLTMKKSQQQHNCLRLVLKGVMLYILNGKQI